MTKEEEKFEAIIKSFDGAEVSQMFGKPCGKYNKKAFVAFFQNEMVFKVGREENVFLLEKYTDSQLFDPSGKKRAMKDWIQVPSEYVADWAKLAQKAFDFTT